jgi:hypothetical protein
MLVSFLQALLTMLRKELDSFGAGKGSPADELASLVGATVAAASGTQLPAIADASATPATSDKGGGNGTAKSSQPDTAAGSRRLKRKER